MREKPKKMKSEELYNKIIDSLIENELNEHSTPEEYLESQGVDANKLLKDGLSIVNQWKNKVRLEKRRSQFETIKKRLQDVWPQLALTPKENLKKKLVDIVAGDNEQLAMVYWHKFEDITDSDLENMVKEQSILDSFIEIFNEVEE
ncbi:MAG: hypothetical protein V3V99_09225 [candidate division Zixibacteria bacterium]